MRKLVVVETHQNNQYYWCWVDEHANKQISNAFPTKDFAIEDEIERTINGIPYKEQNEAISNMMKTYFPYEIWEKEHGEIVRVTKSNKEVL